MATYKGQVKVDISSYDNFKNATNGNGYDVDGYYGCQCYDLGSLFWLNACKRWLRTAAKDGGVKGGASGIWGARDVNNQGEFELITDINALKRGDIIITNNGQYGHICFLDEENTTKVFGQNQGGSNGEMPKAACKVINWNFKKYFLGAFRYKKWIVEEPKPIEQPKVEEPKKEEPKVESTFKVGDKVVPTKLVNHKGIRLVQYDKEYTITELGETTAVLSAPRNGKMVVWARMNLTDIKKI